MSKLKYLISILFIGIIFLVPTIVNAEEGDLVSITFNDKNLYTEILNKSEINVTSYDDLTYTIKMTQKNIDSVGGIFITNREIVDISGIEKFTNLDALSLRGNQISDISPLAELTKLENLFLDGNQISNIKPLANLTNLRYLDLGSNYGNQISDITTLENLTNLIELDILNNKVDNISSLKNLTKLEVLQLQNNEINDISALENLTNLTTLYLWGNNISNVTALNKLTQLTFLSLSHNEISDITALGNLVELTTLDLSYNKISDITALENLANIRNLHLSGNQISDITILERFVKLTNLKSLTLDNNQISDARILENILENVMISLLDQSLEITTSEDEIELLPIFIQAKDINSKMYTSKDFKLINCTLNEDGTKVILDKNKTYAKVKIVNGKLDGSVLLINIKGNNNQNQDGENTDNDFINQGTTGDINIGKTTDTTIAPEILPNAGLNITLVCAISLVIVGAIVAFLKYNKLRDI